MFVDTAIQLGGRPTGKFRLLAVGQAIHPTGYARVFQSLFPYLADTFDIVQFGVNYRKQPVDAGWRIEPNRLLGDPLGRIQLPALLRQHRPHIILLCHDLWFFSVHAPAIADYKLQHPDVGARVVMYCPIESDDLPPAAVRDLATVDLLVAYSDFGRQVLERAFTALEQQCPGTHRPPITVIPHGLDPAVFYPLAEPRMSAGMQQSKRTARAQLFPNRPELQDAVIILNANRNVFRKRVDLTLDAFAHFLADKPDNIYLYLHMGMQDRGVDVLARAATRGLAHRLLTTTHDAPHPQVANAQLNLIYNACDIGVNTATSEGWGLVAFEHAATAAAQILPDHSACTALWQDVGLLIPTMATNGVISVEALATALQHCWHNPAFRHAAALRAYRFATRPQFQWSVIATTWKDLLLEVVCRAHWPPTGRAPPTTSASQAE